MESTKVIDSFFNSLVDMIPVALYRHTEQESGLDADKYHKHRKLPLTVDERKSASKKKIAEKYSGGNENDTVFEHTNVRLFVL